MAKNKIKATLIPKEGGDKFVFPSLPEDIDVNYESHLQSFSIINLGTIKFARGREPIEISWSHVFFGRAIYDSTPSVFGNRAYKNPYDCRKKLATWAKAGTKLNLVISGCRINYDVVISKFEAKPVGGHGNIEYSITFTEKRPLKVYTTKEKKGSKGKKKKTKARTSAKKGGTNKSRSGSTTGTYTVASGDTLGRIAQKKCGGTSTWPQLYSKNKATIEAAARKHGRKNSDNGHWIYPGTKLNLV